MKQRRSGETLLDRANDVFNAGMKLFADVQESRPVEMVKRQAELIELLDRLLSIAQAGPGLAIETARDVQSKTVEPGQEPAMKIQHLPAKEDMPGVARYLLACWLDELFVVDTSLTREWNENKLEMRVFGSNDRAWRFWDYVNSEPVGKSMEVSHIALSCIMHGFQGQLVESHAELVIWVEKCKAAVLQSARDSWSAPPSLPIIADTPPLKGAHDLELAIQLAISFGVLLVPAISFLIVYSLRS